MIYDYCPITKKSLSDSLLFLKQARFFLYWLRYINYKARFLIIRSKIIINLIDSMSRTHGAYILQLINTEFFFRRLTVTGPKK
jgi:hypothetical protein